ADGGADVDAAAVAGRQVGDVAAGRDPLPPGEDLRLVADRERLLLARAEHRPQSGAVTALDGHLHRRRAGVHELAAELEEAHLAGRRRTGGDGRAREDNEREKWESTMFHRLVPPWTGRS